MSVINRMVDEYLNVNTKHKYTLSTYLCKYTGVIHTYYNWYYKNMVKRLEQLELQAIVKRVKSEHNGVAWIWA